MSLSRIDLCLRCMVGWAFADHVRAELVTDALKQALGTRQTRSRPHLPQRP